ncbi:trihelix transcription factor ASIL2-like [Prunus avium]|uniref:Trihelix transcription factor ASIL2-like n=1 Tax=Prunus avium TaxID=42229 RepID=A0A6P5RVR7_PRUAV|nr:trihelix transcription factor ASIL2-like [Prunus avium]XP_021807195.1 trihelix transcription factor ASIL2-like [Prunus avium]XP_021807196.1 trihelix transcription factor ASIL2-like [Prunus avium]
MDDMDDDARYHSKAYSLNHHNSSGRRKINIRNTQYSRPIANRYAEEDDDELDEFDEGNGRRDHDEEEEEEEEHPRGLHRNFEADDGFERHTKKRKVKNLESSYEFAPRGRVPYRDPSPRGEEDWTEHAVFVLLEVWGDRFLQLGRKSLRSEDWHEVAEKVSEASKIERTDTQCRSMLDMLKRKYKKEKEKVEEMGLNSSKWAYFKKMDMLMASSLRQECGLACGVDSGEYVFMNTRVYLERSNGFDEMRDSPGESETDDDQDGNDDQDAFPPRMGMRGGDRGEEGSSYRVLADSIHKFGEIYEKIESSKRQQMRELEKMRKDFHKELEFQKKQILERAQVEIAKIQEADDDDETDVSAEDLSE